MSAHTSLATTKINAKTSKANAKTAAAASKFAAQTSANVSAYAAELQNAFNTKKLSQDKILKLKEFANKLETTLANNDAEKAAHAAKTIGKQLKDAGITGEVYDAVRDIGNNINKKVVGSYVKAGTKVAKAIRKATSTVSEANKNHIKQSLSGGKFY